MGAVYRAVREDDFCMEVAIKLLKRGTDTDAALARFRFERQILAWLHHPNIARLLDGGGRRKCARHHYLPLGGRRSVA
jgi:serine/threonine-protein kinase